MSLQRGVVTERSSTSARPIEVTSILPIALVLTSNVEAGLYSFDKPIDAIKYFEDKHTSGNLMKYLKVGYDKYNVIVPTIISVANVVDVESGVKTEDEAKAETKTNVINATNILKAAGTSKNKASLKANSVGYKPDIIAVADYSSEDKDIATAQVSTTDAIKARTFLDLNSESNASAITKRNEFGSERLTLAATSFTDWNTQTSQEEFYDSGVCLAWLRARVDAEKKTGYAASISNRLIKFSGLKRSFDFVPGASDETDPLTENQIMSFIEYSGLRTWEYATCSVDAIWQDARRLRIFDLAADAVLKGVFFAVDKDLGALTIAKRSLKGFMDGLVGDDVMLGYNIFLDEERTTPERISAGEFYFVIDMQEIPSPRLICVRLNRVDYFSPRVYEIIAAA